MLEKEPQKTIIKDLSRQAYRQEDDKDFHISDVERNVLTDSLPERDDEQTFDADMYNFGDEDNLPDSDRLMECQSKGVSQKKCLDI